MLQLKKNLPVDFPQFSTGLPPCHQNFSFPCYMMSHITSKVSTPQVYQKLTQTCKYFYSKNPVAVVEGITISSMNPQIIRIGNHLEYRELETKLLKEFPSKFWIASDLLISNLDAIDFATLTSKIYRFILAELEIQNVKLKYSDLVLLSFKGTFIKVGFYKCNIIHDSPIDISDVFKLFVDATYLCLDCTPTVTFTSDTVKKLMDIPAFPKLERLLFFNVPETLNLDEFIKFKNLHLNFWTNLGFLNTISDTYKKLIVDSKQKLLEAEIYVNDF